MSVQNLFGTDGIRTSISNPLLAPENVIRLGRVLANIVKSNTSAGSITIGRDSRASGEYLQEALVAGIRATGVDCHLVGILPTAGIAFLGKKAGSYFSITISASHNPYTDNGFKIFGSGGQKIAKVLERAISKQFFAELDLAQEGGLSPGKIIPIASAERDYVAMLMAQLPADFSMAGYRVVVDCGHGAASHIAPKIFAKLGCDVKFIGATPNGQNINRGYGSEHPDNLKNEVCQFHAHVGIAFDGDADRVIFINEKGESIDGDALIAAFSQYLHSSGQLKNKTIVATVMSSMALDNALAPHGIKVLRSNVGDRQVAELMALHSAEFGGESSGHLIFHNEIACGDGLYSALQFFMMMKRANVSLSELFSFFKPTPLVMKNIDVTHKIPLSELPLTKAAIDSANALGRALFRYSGTEMKARLLVEASTQDDCQRIADEIMQKFITDMISNTP